MAETSIGLRPLVWLGRQSSEGLSDGVAGSGGGCGGGRLLLCEEGVEGRGLLDAIGGRGASRGGETTGAIDDVTTLPLEGVKLSAGAHVLLPGHPECVHHALPLQRAKHSQSIN